MSPAVTGPGPFLCRRSSAESRVWLLSATDFRFRRMSTTSSCTPSIEVYSCSTPSISTSVMAVPGMDDSSTRRSALPRVWPKPRSNGSITTRAWRGATGCTLTTRGLRNSLTEPCIALTLPAQGPAQRKPRRTGLNGGARPRFQALRLLRIQLDDQVLVDVRQHVIAPRGRLEHPAELLGAHVHPVRQPHLGGHVHGALDAQLLARLLAHLDAVAGLHLVGGDGHRLLVHGDRLVAHQLARLGARGGEAHAVHDVVQAALEQPQQVLARGAGLARRFLVVVAELPLQHPVHAAQLLLLAQLRTVIGQALTALALDAARRHGELALVLERLDATLEEQIGALAAGELAGGTGITRHRFLVQTRRFFGGRHPLCGIGVTSEMLVIFSPQLLSARTADSRPGPGPPTRTSTFFTPCSWAATPAFSAATCAANGVLLREPRKPQPPAVAQERVFPCRSVMVMIVLLNEACTCAIASSTFLRAFFAFFGAAAAAAAAGAPLAAAGAAAPWAGFSCAGFCCSAIHQTFPAGALSFTACLRGPLRVRALVRVRWPRTGRPRR